MQTLDVISINLWQVLVSLANLVLLFLLVKKFLYKPVKEMLEQRQSTIDGEYAAALREGRGCAMDVRCFFKTFISILRSEGVVEGGTGELEKKEKLVNK